MQLSLLEFIKQIPAIVAAITTIIGLIVLIRNTALTKQVAINTDGNLSKLNARLDLMEERVRSDATAKVLAEKQSIIDKQIAFDAGKQKEADKNIAATVAFEKGVASVAPITEPIVTPKE